MRPLLDPHIDPEPWWKRLLEADSDAQADDGGEGAVRDGGGDEDGEDGERGVGRERREGDVGEVDDGEGAEREGVFGVRDGGDEIVDFLLVDRFGGGGVDLRVWV